MIDIHWADLTKAPDEPNQNGWITLTNEQWEKVINELMPIIKSDEYGYRDIAVKSEQIKEQNNDSSTAN